MISLIIKVYQFKVWGTLKYCERKGELHAKSLTEPVVLHEYLQECYSNVFQNRTAIF